jgi:LysM repeat protein
MHKLFRLVTLAALLTACGARPTLTAAPPSPTLDARTAALAEAVNVVEARAAETEAFAPVSLGYLLRAGGQVQTGDASKARLDFSDGTIVRLAQKSTFAMQTVTTSDQGLLAHVRLEAGKLWVSLTGGTLQVETPVGVAAVRGSFAVIQYDPGDPANPDDDLLVLDCLEGSCTAQNDNVDQQLGNLERVVLNRTGFLRMTLTGADVDAFLKENPEGQRLAATLTAAPPATDTPSPSATHTPRPSPTLTPSSAPTVTGSPTETPLHTATPIPATIPPVAILGQHTVRAGETLFCIGRGYGVLPEAIALVNGLVAPFNLAVDQVLKIPAVRWTDIPPGPVCPPQFTPVFPALAPNVGTATFTPTITLTPTPTCPAGQFFDPFQQRCRPPDAPVPTGTPTATALPPTFTPTATATPGIPAITGLNPASVQAGSPGFTLVVNGTNFVPGSVVLWNGASRSTTFVSATQLSAAISAADIITIGSASITVFTPPPGGGTSRPATLSIIDTIGPTIANITINPPPPTSIGSSTSCQVVISADISDPSGVSIANVDWIATNTFTGTPTPAGTGSVPMSPLSGTTWQVTWTVSLINGPFPYYGTVTWSITAVDGSPSQNSNNVAGVTVIDVPASQGGCP